MTEKAGQSLVNRMDGPEDKCPASIERPAWNDIEKAIRRLDGNTCSLLVLGIGDPVPHMAIGGGDAGKYTVYVTPDNWTFHSLVNSHAQAGRSYLVAGGQLGDYANKHVVGLEDVLRAAHAYAETGGLDPGLLWEKRG